MSAQLDYHCQSSETKRGCRVMWAGVSKCDLSDVWTNWARSELGIFCKNMFSNEERIVRQPQEWVSFITYFESHAFMGLAWNWITRFIVPARGLVLSWVFSLLDETGLNWHVAHTSRNSQDLTLHDGRSEASWLHGYHAASELCDASVLPFHTLPTQMSFGCKVKASQQGHTLGRP